MLELFKDDFSNDFELLWGCIQNKRVLVVKDWEALYTFRYRKPKVGEMLIAEGKIYYPKNYFRKRLY